MKIDNLENERENKNRRIDRPDMFYSLYIPESEDFQIQLENHHQHCTFTLKCPESNRTKVSHDNCCKDCRDPSTTLETIDKSNKHVSNDGKTTNIAGICCFQTVLLLNYPNSTLKIVFPKP